MTLQEVINKIASLQVEQWTLMQELKAMVGVEKSDSLLKGQAVTKREQRFPVVPETLRAKAEDMLVQGSTVRTTMEATGLSSSTVERMKKKLRDTGKLKRNT